jgi:GT2 family glycosyltransferase
VNREALHSCSTLIKAACRLGGNLPLLRESFEILKLEGWSGLTRRLLSYGESYQYSTHYGEWIVRYDALNDEKRSIIRTRIKAFPHLPVVSVVMPTHNTKPQWLIEAIESVRNQLYPNWELCIVDDASTDSRVRPILERYISEDDRIKVVFRKTNGHISAASNSALQLATGDYITFLDHDDLLHEHALYWVVDAIVRHPDAQLIYSDEDKIDTSGRRSTPYFKCGWNQDLFYSQNMICHLAVYKTNLIQESGGFREGYEGAQDYDLALRCIERIDPKDILHIPRVLYHWRAHRQSTALAGTAKAYALSAGERALNEHFQRRRVCAVVESLSHLRMYRVHYQLPQVLPMVSLVVIARNGSDLIHQCIRSILQKTTYRNYEVVIMDNVSNDPKVINYLESLKAQPQIRIIRDNGPFNFSAFNNAAVQCAHGEIIGLLNDDTEVISPDWLSEMVSHAVRPEVGAVGGRLLYPNNTVQHAGVILGIRGVAGYAHKKLSRYSSGYFRRAVAIQSLSAVKAACLLIRREVYLKVGGLNEDLGAPYSDIDFCLKLREAGYRNIYTPYAELYHHESGTERRDDTGQTPLTFEKEQQYMKKRWKGLLLDDPAYNPNLTLEDEDFGLAWPPRVDLLGSGGLN